MACDLLSASLGSIPNVTVLNVAHYSNGASIPLPYMAKDCASYSSANATTDLCQVVLNVSTSATSTDRIEGWLPDNWNGRLLASGNGGTGGCIDYPNLQHGASFGFATFGTNIGHDGQFGYEFFLNQPETVNDFGYRAVHAEVVVAKQVVEKHFGRNASYNYYSGCSTGGRQGYEEAILYPEDFDGILLGSMGVDWLHIVASKGILPRRMEWPNLVSPSYISAAQWSAIVAAQLQILDPLDGVKDGIIDNPTLHNFDPTMLACGTGILNSSVCLTAAQVNTVREVYQPLANGEGEIVFPGFELGIDTSVFSANTATVNGTVVPQLRYPYLQDFWRGAVYNDSTWTPNNFSIADMDFAVNLNPGGIQIAGDISHDVSAYHARGGKLLAYHGRQDQTVMSAIASRTFQRTADETNLTLAEMHDFFRLFFIPGMAHCGGGPGAWSIGQATIDRPVGLQFNDTQHSVLLALVDWVEGGNAPTSIVGTKFSGDALTTGGPVEAQRTHCVYPNASYWDGVGDAKVAESWECRLEGS
jgi:feruloyl esterase